MPRGRGEEPYERLVKQLAVRIAELRSAKNMTQLELARAAAMGLQFITKLEHGERAPSLKTIAALAVALDVPVAALFNFESRTIRSPRVDGQLLRLRDLLGDATEDDAKLVVRLAQRLVDGPVSASTRRQR